MGSKKADFKSTTEEEIVAHLRQEIVELKAEKKELKALATKSLQEGKHVKWRKLSERWQNDRDFIVAAIRGDRVDWHTLPARWKADFAVACASVLSKPPQHSEPVPWSDFPESLRDFAVEHQPALVLEALKNSKIEWNDVPDSLKYHNRDISLFGVENSHVRTEDCPCLDDHNDSRGGCQTKQHAHLPDSKEDSQRNNEEPEASVDTTKVSNNEPQQQAHLQDSKEDSQRNNEEPESSVEITQQQAHLPDSKKTSESNSEEPEASVDTTKVSNGEKQQQDHPKDNDMGTRPLSEKELAAYKAVDKGYTTFEEQRALAAKRQSRPSRQISKSLKNTTSIKDRMAAMKLKAGKPKLEWARNKTVVEEPVLGLSAESLPRAADCEVRGDKEQQSQEKSGEDDMKCTEDPKAMEECSNMEHDDKDPPCSEDEDAEEEVVTVKKVRNEDNDDDNHKLSEKELASYKAVDKGYTTFEEQRALAAKRQTRPSRQISKSLKNTTSIKDRLAALKAAKKQ